MVYRERNKVGKKKVEKEWERTEVVEH